MLSTVLGAGNIAAKKSGKKNLRLHGTDIQDVTMNNS